MKKFLALILALILCFAFVACGEEPVDEPVPVNPITVYMSIVDNPDDDVVPENFEAIEKAAFEIEEGTSLLDATQVYCVGHNVDFELSADESYFTSIAGLSEKDYVDTTGWIFEVNGESVMIPSGDVELKEGDVVTWEFVDFSTMSW